MYVFFLFKCFDIKLYHNPLYAILLLGNTLHVCMKTISMHYSHLQSPDTLIDTILCVTFKDFDPVFQLWKQHLHVRSEFALDWHQWVSEKGQKSSSCGTLRDFEQGENHTALFLLSNKALTGFYFSTLWARISIVCIYLPQSRYSSLAGVLSCVNIPTASPLQDIVAENQAATPARQREFSVYGSTDACTPDTHGASV